MKRKIERSYSLDQREIREAILAWIKAKDLPSPSYVGNTPTCTWYDEDGGVRIEWMEEGEVEP